MKIPKVSIWTQSISILKSRTLKLNQRWTSNAHSYMYPCVSNVMCNEYVFTAGQIYLTISLFIQAEGH